MPQIFSVIPAHITAVRFHEKWPFAAYPKGHGHQDGGGWMVTLDQHHRVQSIQPFGAVPPQLWR